MEAADRVADLARLALFADLRWPELESIVHEFEEDVFAPGRRILRQGLGGNSFYVVIEGEASVHVDGVERRRLGRGDFFGEISVLTGGAPSADIRAETLLRCLVLPGTELEPLLLAHPALMLRMLQAEALRLRDSNRWV
jgi:CRP-like cAMP-binding protein